MPGYKKFFHALEKSLIRDFPFTSDNAKRCLSIYGKEVAKLKGSRTRKKASKIGRMEILPLPLTLVESHSSDILGIDHLYVQGISFHQNISTGYKFRTIEALRGKKNPNHNDIKDQLIQAVNIYHARGIAVE